MCVLLFTLLLRELLKLKHDDDDDDDEDATLRDDLPNTLFIVFDDVVNDETFIIALAIIFI